MLRSFNKTMVPTCCCVGSQANGSRPVTFFPPRVLMVESARLWRAMRRRMKEGRGRDRRRPPDTKEAEMKRSTGKTPPLKKAVLES